jgi:hypothetical protein
MSQPTPGSSDDRIIATNSRLYAIKAPFHTYGKDEKGPLFGRILLVSCDKACRVSVRPVYPQ